MSDLLFQTITLLAAVAVAGAAVVGSVMTVLTFRRQHKIDAKVSKIQTQTDGMLKTMSKAAYDRGAADEEAGDAAPKAPAP